MKFGIDASLESRYDSRLSPWLPQATANQVAVFDEVMETRDLASFTANEKCIRTEVRIHRR